LSATSDAIFLASKLQKIVIRRHQEIGDIAVDLGDGEGGRCPPPSRANDNKSDAVVGFFERKEFASSSLRQMPFVKITFNVGQDKLSANQDIKNHLVPIIEYLRNVFTRLPAINILNILSTPWRAVGEILLNLLDRTRFGLSILPVVITTHSIHLGVLCRRPVTRIKVSGVLTGRRESKSVESCEFLALSLSKVSGLSAGLRVEQIVWLALDQLPARAYFRARTSTCLVRRVVAVCRAFASFS